MPNSGRFISGYILQPIGLRIVFREHLSGRQENTQYKKGDKMTYTISEAAEKSGIGPHTIRFYDRQGLLPFMIREPGGTRNFSDLDMECLEIIRMLKETGMKIKEIKKYLDLCVIGDAALEERLLFMQTHKKEVERQISEYQKYMEVIEYKLWYYQTAIKAGTEYIHDEYYNKFGISSREKYRKEVERK